MLEVKGIKVGSNHLANSIESLIALFMHREQSRKEVDLARWNPQ